MIQESILRLQQSSFFGKFPNFMIQLFAGLMYFIPLIVIFLILLSLFFYYQNRSPNKVARLGQSKLWQLKMLVVSYTQFYTYLFSCIRQNKLAANAKNLAGLFGILLAFNVIGFSILPLSNRFFGFQTENDLLFVIALLLVNIAGFSLSLGFAEEPKSRFSITYQSRLLLLIFLVLTAAFTTILVYFKYNNFTSIISTQANYFGGFIPRWLIFISPLHLINGISCYLFIIILTQILLQYNRPIPLDFTNIFPLSEKPILGLIQAAWKFSLLIIVSLIWIILYAGAFLSPLNNTINLASTTGQLFWFLLKVVIFWSTIIIVNRKIPDLISEQILKLGYWFILPMQMVLLMLTVIIKFSS